MASDRRPARHRPGGSPVGRHLEYPAPAVSHSQATTTQYPAGPGRSWRTATRIEAIARSRHVTSRSVRAGVGGGFSGVPGDRLKLIVFGSGAIGMTGAPTATRRPSSSRRSCGPRRRHRAEFAGFGLRPAAWLSHRAGRFGPTYARTAGAGKEVASARGSQGRPNRCLAVVTRRTIPAPGPT